MAASLALAIALLASFQIHYFGGMRSYRGQHRTYWTAGVEPKLRALAVIEEMRDRQRTTVVVTGDYWTYWPIRYLARNHRDIEIRVHAPERYSDYETQIGPVTPFPDGAEIFYVVFAGSELDRRLEKLRTPGDTVEIRGFAKKSILRIHRFRGKDGSG
jgi:hypothetical protein